MSATKKSGNRSNFPFSDCESRVQSRVTWDAVKLLQYSTTVPDSYHGTTHPHKLRCISVLVAAPDDESPDSMISILLCEKKK